MRCALAVLASMLFASVTGLLAWGPVGFGEQVHRVTDPRAVFGLLNGGSVVLQLPLLAAAAAGVRGMRHSRAGAALRRAWALFFAAVLLATLIGIADHLAPSDSGDLLTRVATGSVCAVLSALFLAERLGAGWVSAAALRLALASGPLGGLLCLASQALLGAPDLRGLLWLEYLPVLLLPLGVWKLRSAGLSGRDWLVALLCFGAAKLVDWADGPVWQASGGVISGHALHHLPLLLCVAWLAWRAPRQRGAPAATPAEIAASVAASQRETSLTTAG